MISGYLDNAATTPVSDAAKKAIIDALDCFGNPSSLHSLGVKSGEMLDRCRLILADSINAQKNEIYFTSGGTESDNIAVMGAVSAMKRRGNRIVTTSVEHSAVLAPMNELDSRGFDVIFLKPDKSGSVPIEAFEKAIDRNTILVSAMLINNEVGAFMPVEKLKGLVNKAGSPAIVHCDATQAFGKYPLNVAKMGIDLMTVSSHKIHGPKGVGALYIKNGVRILPITYGGGHEQGIRPGTESLPLIAGFAAAAGEFGNLKEKAAKVKEIKDHIINALSQFEDIVFNSNEHCSDYVLNFSVVGIRSETMLHFLEQRGVFVSSGSACSKGKASHVLTAMGLGKPFVDSAIRVSFSSYTTMNDAEMLIEGIKLGRKSLFRAKR